MTGLDTYQDLNHERLKIESLNVMTDACTEVANRELILPSEHRAKAMAAFDQETPQEMQSAAAFLADLFKQAMILVRHKEFSYAMNIYRNILMREQNHPEALCWLGFCLKETGNLGDALKCYKAWVRIRREPASLYALAELLYLLERDGEAAELFTETLALISTQTSLHFDIFKNLGNIHVRAADFDAAEECYDKAFRINPRSDALMVNYGTLEIQRENFAVAVQRFRAAVEINSENDRGWVGLALVHRQMGDLHLAWANVERAIDINPQNHTALGLIVEWGMHDHDLTPAVRRLKEYLAVSGEDAEMSFTLAKIFAHLGRVEEAILELERTLNLDPQIAGGANLLAVLLDHRKVKRGANA